MGALEAGIGIVAERDIREQRLCPPQAFRGIGPDDGTRILQRRDDRRRRRVAAPLSVLAGIAIAMALDVPSKPLRFFLIAYVDMMRAISPLRACLASRVERSKRQRPIVHPAKGSR